MIANNSPVLHTVQTIIASIDSLVSRGVAQDGEKTNRVPYLGHVPYFAPKANAKKKTGIVG